MRDSLAGTGRRTAIAATATVALCLLPASALGLPRSLGKRSQIARIAQAPDGRIYAAGSTDDCVELFTTCGASSALIAAYTPKGHLDRSFGPDGGVVVERSIEDETGRADSIGVQSDGKIVVDVVDTAPEGGAALQRFDTDGTRDMSFGDEGRIALPHYGTIVIDPDDKIVVLGNGPSSNAPEDSSIYVSRYLPDGQPDHGFGTEGTAEFPQDPEDDEPAGGDLHRDSQGRYVFLVDQFDEFGARPIAVMRLNSDGSPDSDFGSDGIATAVAPRDETLSADGLGVEPDDGIIVGASSSSDEAHGCWVRSLSRLDPDGQLDSSFGDDGLQFMGPPFGCSRMDALSVSDSGRIYSLSSDFGFAEGIFQIGLTASGPDGLPDTSFGGDGGAGTPPPAAESQPTDVIPEDDGGALVAGYSGSHGYRCLAGSARLVGDACGGMLLARYDRNGVLEQDFGVGGVSVVPHFDVCRVRETSGRLILPENGRRVTVRLRYRAYAGGRRIFVSFAAGPRMPSTRLLNAAIQKSKHPRLLERSRKLDRSDLELLRSAPPSLRIELTTSREPRFCRQATSLNGFGPPPVDALGFRTTGPNGR